MRHHGHPPEGVGRDVDNGTAATVPKMGVVGCKIRQKFRHLSRVLNQMKWIVWHSFGQVLTEINVSEDGYAQHLEWADLYFGPAKSGGKPVLKYTLQDGA